MTARGGPFILWRPHRALRLAADRLFAEFRPEFYGDVRIALSTIRSFHDLVRVLKARREDAAFSRYREEALLVAFEARLKRDGLAKLPDALHYEFRRDGLGLDAGGKLIHSFDACLARYRDRPLPEIPEAVRLIVAGSRYRDFDAAAEELATIASSDEPWRRRRNFPEAEHRDLRYFVLKEWVEANGWRLRRHEEAVARFIEHHRDATLATEPTNSFANLSREMVGVARDLAHRVAPNDPVIAYYVFRVLQRVEAYRRGDKVMWNARWLRGAKYHRAIEGASGKPALEEVIREHILIPEKGHSGATGQVATYRVRIEIQGGDVDEEAAASEYGLRLDAKRRPRRGRGGRIVVSS